MLGTALRLALAVAPTATPVVPNAPAPTPGDTGSPSIELPRWRGFGLFVSGGILGSFGLTLKIAAAASDARHARESDRTGAPSTCFDACGSTVLNIYATPLLLSSMALLSGGTNVHGRWASYRDAANRRPHDRRKTGLMIGLGSGAIGVGLGTWLATRFTFRRAETKVGQVAVFELGWWTAIVGVYGGAGSVGYGAGYRSARYQRSRRLRTRVTPVLSRELVGVGVSGSF